MADIQALSSTDAPHLLVTNEGSGMEAFRSSYGEEILAAASGVALPALQTTRVNARVPRTRPCAASSPRQDTWKNNRDPSPMDFSDEKPQKKKCPCPEFMDSQKRCPHCLTPIWWGSGDTLECATYGHRVHIECWDMEGEAEGEAD